MRVLRYRAGWPLIGFSILASAFAFAQEKPADADPGYVEQDGKRIPSRITPPRKEEPQPPSRVAGRQESKAEPIAEDVDDEAVRQERLLRKYYAEQRRWRVREYGVGGTARYRAPVTFGTSPAILPHGAYYGMDPWGIQAAIDQAYALGREDEAWFSRRLEGEIETAARSKRVLAAHNRALDGSLEQLKNGQFAKSGWSLALATNLD